MTISPSSMGPEHNMKPREVYCPRCKKVTISGDMAPICAECGTHQITVIKSVLDGKRFTGDELVTRDNKTT